MTSADRAANDLLAAVRHGASTGDLAEAVSRALAPVVPHDAVYLVGTCPTAGFGPESFSFWHGAEVTFGHDLLHDYNSGVHPLQPEELLRRVLPAGVTTAEGAARDLFRTHGVGCEMRLLLRDARGVWGTLGLLRAQDGKAFDDADVEHAHRLTPTLIRFLHDYVVRGPLVPTQPAPPPGVVILGPDHAIRSASPQARGMLDWLRGGHSSPEWVFLAFLSGLSMRLRRQPPGTSLTMLGPAANFGRWMMCQAQFLDGSAGEVAAIIQPASAPQLLPQFGDWYGLTARERQIAAALCGGGTLKQLARRLDLSVHTVNDHLKSVYRKTGVTGRDELAAALIT
ncbi:helix-turn-helix transcriptional regulator [Actinomadura terrae]|uniref:helix-turn-helix transcriptional regulator n=1 Tax=Actinomadura terrae TaxID=604353 RepID=UPI001FA6ACC4|nr:LuxR C-terminal-related transcriptional regulator [Actinomadura terrae]